MNKSGNEILLLSLLLFQKNSVLITDPVIFQRKSKEKGARNLKKILIIKL